MFGLFTPQSHAKPYPLTAAHQAFGGDFAWLNTSRPLQPEDLQGRVILLDFWTFCCINCMHIVPDLQYLEQKFGDKLTVIGVHSAKFQNEKDTQNIRNAMLRYGIHHPVVNDAEFKIWQKFGVRAWPTLILIRPDGRIANVYSGEGHREELEEDIRELIEESKGRLETKPLPIKLETVSTETPSLLRFPGKLEYAADRGLLFISDSGHHRIIGATPEGEVRYVIGSGKEGNRDGSFAEAQFHSPQGMAYRAGVLYVADTENHTLRAVDLAASTVRTIAGTGQHGYQRGAKNAAGLSTPLASPWDLAFYPDGEHLTIAMAGTHQLWTYDLKQKTVSVLAGNGRESIDDGAYPLNSLSQPSGLAVDGDALYFVDSETSSLRVLEGGEIRTLIGTGLFDFGFADGEKGEALLQHALGVAVEKPGQSLLIADSYNHSIRRYDIRAKTISTLIGNGKRGQLDEPNDMLLIGDVLFIADTNHHQLRRFSGGKLETVALEQKVEVKRQPEASLPNLKASSGPIKAAGVGIALQPGWKINAQAPSSLAVFAEGREEPVRVFDQEYLISRGSSQFFLVELLPGQYLLQGTLYFCKDAPNAPCLVQSVSQPLIYDGKAPVFTLELR